MEHRKALTDYIKARYALLVIESFEEERVIKELTNIAKDINHTLFVWNTTEGVTLNGAVVGEKTTDLKQAIDFCESKAKESNSRCLFVFTDAHNYLDSKSNPVYRRRLKDFAMNIRAIVLSFLHLLKLAMSFRKRLLLLIFHYQTEMRLKKSLHQTSLYTASCQMFQLILTMRC